MRGFFAFLMLAGAFGLTTLIAGWWAAPALGAVWGLVVPPARAPGRVAAGAASLSWLLLLGWTATRGHIQSLVDIVGAVFGVPGPVLYVVTVVFAAVTAGLAAVATGVVRTMIRR